MTMGAHLLLWVFPLVLSSIVLILAVRGSLKEHRS